MGRLLCGVAWHPESPGLLNRDPTSTLLLACMLRFFSSGGRRRLLHLPGGIGGRIWTMTLAPRQSVAGRQEDLEAGKCSWIP